jgi:hypothetical protein
VGTAIGATSTPPTIPASSGTGGVSAGSAAPVPPSVPSPAKSSENATSNVGGAVPPPVPPPGAWCVFLPLPANRPGCFAAVASLAAPSGPNLNLARLPVPPSSLIDYFPILASYSSSVPVGLWAPGKSSRDP